MDLFNVKLELTHDGYFGLMQKSHKVILLAL